MRLKLLVICTGAVWLAGCTLTPEKTGTMSNVELQEALQKQQQEWQDMKPQLQRVLALESDLKLLVETLDTVPESSESLTQELAPKAEAAQQANQAPVMPSAALADINAPKEEALVNASTSSRNEKPFRQAPPSNAVTAEFYDGSETKSDVPYYGVQLAAYASEKQAIQGWRSITQKYAEEFADTAPLINQHKIDGKTYHQLIVGPFLKKAYSVDFCNMLKQMQQDCLVTRYKGEPFLSL
ncbi:SPOR domain-containing protein [Marinomonas gallaica]|uniref:SPOR domain-containing protein n=1 Tax=Marinomonas gallaica TaxID=1806667 RepID=UPI00082CF37A|nr:SPOR domain-containing protein [Marinomonas gallaica]